MHYGYRKKRLFSFPLLHYAPIPKCFDCFMLTFIVPIWDKQFQIFRGPLQTPFSWSNARSLKETCSKKSCVHNSRSARRICTKFSTRIRHGARRHPYYNFPLGANRVPNSGGVNFCVSLRSPLGKLENFLPPISAKVAIRYKATILSKVVGFIFSENGNLVPKNRFLS